MTLDPSTTLPPAWAEGLLRMTLSEKDRESVSGDLLEEYRESIVPARGRGANAWYVRQVAELVLRQIWVWAALVASICVVRYEFDTLLTLATLGWLATFTSCAAWHAWRTRRIAGALFLVVSVAIVGAEAGTLTCLAIWHDPDTLAALRGIGGLRAALVWPPIALAVLAFVAGLPGAIAGRLGRTAQGWSSANTKIA